ncbi:hypothetical protein BUALT_Bualt02G0026100 [Buddleja alternifolia]|uniref:Uncharacterized protein n=1 Tax=Buddleja alternifolia TaxID=168488 RepID=A0AAV6Y146_9LAMI|nr:hypothetical protein BUALT_Bualt02G0026100 [Buddleja alternifolia]
MAGVTGASLNFFKFMFGPTWHEQMFVAEHKLEEMFVMLFRHQGNMHFNVNIYDQTACEYITRNEDADSEGKTLPTRAWMCFNLIDFDLAILNVPAAGSNTWTVHLQWVSRLDQSGIPSPQMFALKVGWLEFANAN